MPKTAQELWDNIPRKVVVYVADGKGLSVFGKKGESSPSCTVIIGKTSLKTAASKGPNAVWDEFLFFQFKEDVDMEMRIEIKDEKKGKFMGTSPLGKLKGMPHMKLITFNCMLEKRKPKDLVSGTVNIRIYVSSTSELLSSPSQRFFETFTYAPLANKFKTGDLILYSDHGLCPSLLQVYTNSPYSSVGIIVVLGNLWTTRMEFYVVEFTRNLNGMLDAFTECKDRNGVNIFRLFERIHQHHGPCIGWCSLKTPLDAQSQKSLIEYIWSEHAKTDQYEFTANLPEDGIAKYMTKDHSFGVKRKNQSEVPHLYSTNWIASALKKTSIAGSIPSDKIIYPSVLQELPVYEKVAKIKSSSEKAIAQIPKQAIKPPQTVNIIAVNADEAQNKANISDASKTTPAKPGFSTLRNVQAESRNSEAVSNPTMNAASFDANSLQTTAPLEPKNRDQMNTFVGSAVASRNDATLRNDFSNVQADNIVRSNTISGTAPYQDVQSAQPQQEWEEDYRFAQYQQNWDGLPPAYNMDPRHSVDPLIIQQLMYQQLATQQAQQMQMQNFHTLHTTSNPSQIPQFATMPIPARAAVVEYPQQQIVTNPGFQYHQPPNQQMGFGQGNDGQQY